MPEAIPNAQPAATVIRPFRWRVWHIMLLVAYVAVAVVDVQDHRSHDPVLIGLAGVGFTGYALLAWLGWIAVPQLERTIGAVPAVALYLAAMAGLFLLATVVYLVVEHLYLC